MMQLLKRVWLPLVAVVVIGVAGFTVDRIRGVFASDPPLTTPVEFANDPEPFDPKVLTYEIFGPEGAAVDVNYVDLEGEPQRVDGAILPWSVTLQTTEPSAAANIVAQGKTSFLGCRVTVDGEVKDERTSTGTNVQTFCIVKSA
ncbi:MmpS family protein [Mycolicibacterium goodii]|uniref:MmpS family transport accessory protein n=1 Tax=Mycolicibacterium goodii TaxID=134601 RepID=UPI00093C6E54|nr:MmpS family transport accessory protein [Mycolicibacterium goodii]MBU8808691.1 MmpS family protein [Mycolicibacterium goodii]OKH75776.1 membrane protein [Mycobacterium sp. SWH-M5]